MTPDRKQSNLFLDLEISLLTDTNFYRYGGLLLSSNHDFYLH